MKAFIAKNAGFCFGVQRAITLAEKTAKRKKKIYTLGPLIHNPQEVQRLRKIGIKEIKDPFKLPDQSVLLIRTHGIPKALNERLKKEDLKLVDATCPFVKRALNVVKSLARKNVHIVIVGDRRHPEVRALVSYKGDRCIVVKSPMEARKLKIAGKISVVSQTTQTQENFNAVVSVLKKIDPKAQVFNTICRATVDRQGAAKALAQKVDVIIVVGGRNSGNTNKLADICSKKTKTHHIETVKEIKESWFRGDDSIGITAGASTPDWIIKIVTKRIEQIIKKNYNRTLKIL